MANTSGAAGAAEAFPAGSISNSRQLRYHLEYEMARTEAVRANSELQHALLARASLDVIAAASKRSSLATARLYTAVACLILPP